jgi:biopolymer transport protein ExbD
MARKRPEIPSSSLADIAFMILIFFLVTATMDQDFGLERRLPPMSEDPKNEDIKIKERNVFIVLVDAANRLLVEGELLRVDDLKDKAKEFMSMRGDNFPETELPKPEDLAKIAPYYGDIEVTKGVISLQNHIGTEYGTYLAVQNELVKAINELREEEAQKKFGKSYINLEKEQQDAIKIIYPSRISEAEPKKIGGN